MARTHIHLVITHLRKFGSVLGGLALAYGLWAKSSDTKIAAYGLFIISSIGAGIANLTGEAAEETLENLHGVLESTIGRHEDFALFALITLIFSGVASILGLLLILKKIIIHKYSRFCDSTYFINWFRTGGKNRLFRRTN
jgi:hypothetical protein